MSLSVHQSFKYISVFLLGLVIGQLNATAALAKKPHLIGPIYATVERVIDGDTLIVKAKIWLDQELTVRVRLSGIDAPELKSHNPHHRRLAIQATNILKKITSGRQITLRNIRRGKYAGRVIADVYLNNGIQLSKYLLEHGLAVPYGRRFKIRHNCRANHCAPQKIDIARQRPLH